MSITAGNDCDSVNVVRSFHWNWEGRGEKRLLEILKEDIP
jgi:hypothetical protein